MLPSQGNPGTVPHPNHLPGFTAVIYHVFFGEIGMSVALPEGIDRVHLQGDSQFCFLIKTFLFIMKGIILYIRRSVLDPSRSTFIGRSQGFFYFYTCDDCKADFQVNKFQPLGNHTRRLLTGIILISTKSFGRSELCYAFYAFQSLAKLARRVLTGIILISTRKPKSHTEIYNDVSVPLRGLF